MSTQTKEEQEKVSAGKPVSAKQEEAQPKKKRRGISNDTRAASRLKFDERRDAKPNGLFIGHLDNVEIKWVTLGEEVQGLQSFAGLAIPILTVTFASNDENESVRRYVTHRMMPAESNALTIVGGAEAWKVDSVLGWMKHLMDVYILKGRPMTEEEEDALCLPFEDSDDEGNYIPVEPQVVVDGWKSMFENFIKMMNNDGKPVYKSATGGVLPIWIKLLRFTKVKNAWQPVVRGKSTMGDLGFTNFVGEGCIELYKQNVAPMLKVDPAKESIVYRETKAAAPAMPAAAPMMGGAMPGVQMGGAMPGTAPTDFAASPFAAGGNPADDLPF